MARRDGEHFFALDAEAELIEAFESFDEGDTGLVTCDEIRRWLSQVGERMGQEEIAFHDFHELACYLLFEIDKLFKGSLYGSTWKLQLRRMD